MLSDQDIDSPRRFVIPIVVVSIIAVSATVATSGTAAAQTGVPNELTDDVTTAQYTAVAGDDGDLDLADLLQAMNGWAIAGSVNGVDVGASELRDIGNYWADEGYEPDAGELEESAVSPDGSTISVSTDGANFVSVSDLPNDVSVSDVSNDGIYNENESSILWYDSGGGLPENVSFTLIPGESYAVGDTVSFDADGTSVTVDVDESNRGNGPVAQEEVSLSGSTISVSTGGKNSISVIELPSGVSVSNVSDGGTFNEGEGAILWTNFGGGLAENVSFTLTPGESYAVGDTISFDADGTSVTVDVVEITVPSELADSVSVAQYSAVVGNDNKLTARDLSEAINGWTKTGSVNGVDIEASELSALINYWANN